MNVECKTRPTQFISMSLMAKSDCPVMVLTVPFPSAIAINVKTIHSDGLSVDNRGIQYMRGIENKYQIPGSCPSPL